MIHIRYNPFGDKQFSELEGKDLEVLREVAEGWYVEYKATATPDSIAKSLAAFSNHYGGWVFYGVVEADDGSNKAGRFPGIASSDLPRFINQINDAAKNSVHPPPYYDYKVINGPCPEIGLSGDRHIIVVAVPDGPDTPYVHRNGRIYRRIGDSSDPKLENDRAVLDQLWRRSQAARNKLAEILGDEPLLSEGESDNVSYIDLFLLPDPLGAIGHHTSLSFDTFVEEMKNVSGGKVVSIVFDHFFSMANGVVARMVDVNDPVRFLTTWRHFRDGSSHVSLPFSSAEYSFIKEARWLNGYVQETAMHRLVKEKGYENCTLIDINQLAFMVFGMLERQKYLLVRGGIIGPFYAKAVLRNVWRRVPFLDTRAYIDFAKEYGLPLIQYNNAYAPPGQSYESLEVINFDDAVNLEGSAKLVAAIFRGLGLSPRVISDTSGWMSVLQRANEVNNNRMKETDDYRDAYYYNAL
jgi:hypothetical protein